VVVDLSLWIVGSEESLGNLVLGVKAHHLPTRKVGHVARDNSMGKSKVTHDVLPEEFDNLLPIDIGERYYFYLFCKVVCGNQ